MVHGFMGGSDQWHLQKSLGEQRHLVCVDLPGFGRNSHLQAHSSITDFAHWVLDELSRLGVTRFDLLGHSMGGMIVQEMVHLAPDRVCRLVLYATGAIGELPGRFESIDASIERAKAEGANVTARRIAATWFAALERAPEYQACADLAAQAPLPSLLAGLRAMQGWSGEYRLHQIMQRCLVIWGDQDRTYDWSQIERLWRDVPKSSLAVVPDCAHAVHAECPKLFNAIVERFLDTC